MHKLLWSFSHTSREEEKTTSAVLCYLESLNDVKAMQPRW